MNAARRKLCWLLGFALISSACRQTAHSGEAQDGHGATVQVRPVFSGKAVLHAGDIGMAVRKAFWNLGIGSAMLETLIRWARTTGVITKLNLRVRADNRHAIHVYQRLGFLIEGTVSREHLIDGHYFSQHCMGLEL